MIRNDVDLDRIVDYKAEYMAVIPDLKQSNGQWTGKCPFHDDHRASFSVDFTTGLWHCFAEDDGGNFVQFWAKIHGYNDTKRAYREILDKYGVHTERGNPKPTTQQTKKKSSEFTSYTLEDYSIAKNLPADWLRECCRVSTYHDRNKDVDWLRIPYYDADGTEQCVRKRYGNKEFRWQRGKKGGTWLYGEWRIPEYQNDGWVILVEGESDAQSLWYMGLPALGVAGASMFKPHQAQLLRGLKVYIHVEPDKGGEAFLVKVTAGLHDGGFNGEAFRWSCKELGTKDPSDLYIKHGKEDAKRMILETCRTAAAVDYLTELAPEPIAGAPIHLRQPEGWIYSEKGISRIENESMNPACICRTPVILTQRFKNIETGEEKIEAAFLRDGIWTSGIYPRSTLFSRQGVLQLAEKGCTVTSENAKQVIQFLGALEAENIDIIPKSEAATVFGWQPGRRFIPGHDEGLTLDLDDTKRSMAVAYCQNGTFDGWLNRMAPHRARDKFRFILAASFAAPLLKIVKLRGFFIYNWGDSKGGKSAALKAALSVWGEPEGLMVSFNTTAVGLERTAELYCDLPLGIDERQQAGDKQKLLEQIVYMISGGKGKVRGSKSGGLQTVRQWRTVAIANGEQPLASDTSMTGVSTRVLEIYGGPFNDEQSAAAMHQQAALDCGWAGPAFIEKILQMDEQEIVEDFERMRGYVQSVSEGKNGAHIASISVVALADALIDRWFFGGSEESAWNDAKRMAKNILITQVESNTTDVNANAVQFITDWVLSNKAYFGKDIAGTCYGFFGNNSERPVVYIYPSLLDQALVKAGYSSPTKVRRYMAEHGIIETSTGKDGKKHLTVAKWFSGATTRFVAFRIGAATDAEVTDIIEEDEQLPF